MYDDLSTWCSFETLKKPKMKSPWKRGKTYGKKGGGGWALTPLGNYTELTRLA